MILVNCIMSDGRVVPAGVASDREDAENMKKWANEKYGLNKVASYEYINNPTEEDLAQVSKLMKSFVDGERERQKLNALNDIYKLYDEHTITGTEAINRIMVLLADDSEEKRENAIRLLYAPNHGHRDYDDYDGYDDKYDDGCDCEEECDGCECHEDTSDGGAIDALYDLTEKIEDPELRKKAREILENC